MTTEPDAPTPDTLICPGKSAAEVLIAVHERHHMGLIIDALRRDYHRHRIDELAMHIIQRSVEGKEVKIVGTPDTIKEVEARVATIMKRINTIVGDESY